MTIEAALQALALPDWTITHVIKLGENDWQIMCHDLDHTVYATGETIELAINHAAEKIHAEKFGGLHWTANRADGEKPFARGSISLRSLGLAGPQVKLRRPNFASSSEA